MIGQTISHYRITDKLGEGGMGEVYLAEDTSLKRQVAFKVLSESLQQDDIAHQRFLREAQSAAALDHPFICHIHEVAQTEEGQDFIVMEYVRGQSLKEKLSDGPLPIKEALRIGSEISEALEEAHRNGIVHRDLKPANIMLTRDGHAKVMDFGLAKKVVTEDGTEQDITSALTREGSTVGTLAYMSPEQLKAQPVDQRSDIFSFGVVLYEMLTGVHPFRKPRETETIGAILHQEPVRLTRFMEYVLELLQHTLNKMLAKESDDRYQSVHEVRTNLRELSVEVSRPSEMATPATRKHSWMPAGLAIVGLILGALVVFWAWDILRKPTPTVEQDRKSIAVLPLENLSVDPGDSYFSDGLTDEIITRLSQINELKVISRTSSMLYRNTDKNAKSIGEELGVAALLEGTVRREEESIRVTVQLIDAETDHHIWAQAYNRELSDIFTIQSGIANNIASALQVELSPQEQNRIEKEPTNSLTAYQFYLKGRDYYYRYGREDIETAVELFSKALEVDPNYALACAGLADAYNQRFIYSGTATTWLDMAIGLSRKAISLDADLSEGYKAMGLAYYLKGWNQRALEAYEKALALDPNNHGAENNMAVVRDKKGKLGEALRGYRRTIVLSPTRPLAHANVGLVYLVLGDDAKAEQWINRGLALNPDNAICRFRLGVLYLRQEEFDLARKQSREIRRNSPNSLYGLNLAGDVELWSGNSLNAKPYYQEAIDLSAPEANPHSRLALGHILWNEGQRSDVQNLFSPLQHYWQQALGQGSESPDLRYNLALMYVVQGNETEAYRWLNEAINAGWRDYRLANRDPRWEKLRHQILFQQMMADVRVKVEEMRRRVREMEKEWDFR